MIGYRFTNDCHRIRFKMCQQLSAFTLISAALLLIYLNYCLADLRRQIVTQTVITGGKITADSKMQVLKLHADEALGEARLSDREHVFNSVAAEHSKPVVSNQRVDQIVFRDAEEQIASLTENGNESAGVPRVVESVDAIQHHCFTHHQIVLEQRTTRHRQLAASTTTCV